MKFKKIIQVLIICIILILPIFYFQFVILEEKEIEKPKNFENEFNPLEGGWFKEKDGVKILYLNGTNYMMGYQHGYYLKEEIGQIYRIIIDTFDYFGCTFETFMEIWDSTKEFIPDKYIEEMMGMSNGSGHSIDKIIVLNLVSSVLNVYYVGGCSGMSAWDSATKNGEIIHFRSSDGTIHLKDEVSGKYFQECQAIFLRNPDEDYNSISFSFVGDVCSWGGFNEKAIAIGETSCKSDDTTFEGINLAFRMRMVLDNADNLDEAVEILKIYRGCGWNNIISDGNENKGIVIEQTSNNFYKGNWNDPVESNRPFYSIEDVVRRTNFFINPYTAETQREKYNPRGLFGLYRFIFKNDVYFFEWQHYKTLSKGIKSNHGTLDLDNTIDMVRDVYSGKGNIIFRYFQNRGGKEPMHQWVANPKTGDFLVSFASVGKCAHEAPVHSFNFYDLLLSEPPQTC